MQGTSETFRHAVLAITCITLAACSLPRAPVTPPLAPNVSGQATQTGIASWYGPGFHGQATASGAIYDQNEMTAAHQTLPLGSRVMVTNLENGKAAEVMINDRGPFAKGRIIDLSHAAARTLGMIGPGTALVRVDVVDSPHPIRDIRSSLDYTLQLGSFSQIENARQLRERLRVSYDDVSIKSIDAHNGTYYRVQLGTFNDRGTAQERARQLARNGFTVLVIEK